ncbi:Ankyrin-3 (ANK-3) (Ankyrin-G) [Durusdinium trenchii]
MVKDAIDSAPANLHITSALRVASQYAKERVDTRWWTVQVQYLKAFVERHAWLFADDPVSEEENEDMTIEEQQEAFARNILLWVKPLLRNQPWRSTVHAYASDEVTLQAAHFNLRRALANLSERRNDVLHDIRQQARCIEDHHLRHSNAGRHTVHTMVSRDTTVAHLETTEIRSEDAMFGSHAHTEVTRDGNVRAELVTILMQEGMSEQQAHAVLRRIQQRGMMAAMAILDPSEVRSDPSEELLQRPSGALPVVIAGRWKTCLVRMVFLGSLASLRATYHHDQSALHRVEEILVSPETEWLRLSLESYEEGSLPHPRRQQKLDSQRSYPETGWLSWLKKPIAKRIAAATVRPFEKASRLLIKTIKTAGVRGLLAAAEHYTALHLAAKKGDQAVVRKLLQAGALHLAAMMGHQDVVNELLQMGAEKEAATRLHYTALHLAAQNGHKEVVDSLLQVGADKNAVAKDWFTALHLAAMTGHQDVVDKLLKVGADKEAATRLGKTALHLAAQNGHKEVVVLT